MKEMIKQYKEEVKQLVCHKRYFLAMIIVSILSYGFAITHGTVGIDDTCLDRYYGDFFSINMISAGRWGSYLLYKLLNITSFTPFWLDFLTVLVIMATAILISAFIRKNVKKQDIILSTLFSCIYISYPLINEAFIFQPSNLALFLSNLLTILSVIVIYEVITNKLQKKYYIALLPILAISISMYESCCQTFLLGLLICMLLRIFIYQEKEANLLKYFATGIIVLILSIILNYAILYMFYSIGVPNELSGGRTIYWFKVRIK